MKNLTWQNPEQLFVAQELINKVKSKCCGIKVLYKKYNVNAVICCFDGYTGLHSKEECISIKEQLEKIRKDSTLKPYWDYSPKEVPILEKFREEIYAFLTDGRE